ncbi:unnamed protein product [Pleuronectes platessa]|uniref:Uncharacterized protein n=1 Tax=Pleuronectes platessa TaxID=8262 RepID=A0A9N7VJW4_PLEPL|nr:unnamed protein product [Pleuronectes platessa]
MVTSDFLMALLRAAWSIDPLTVQEHVVGTEGQWCSPPPGGGRTGLQEGAYDGVWGCGGGALGDGGLLGEQMWRATGSSPHQALTSFALFLFLFIPSLGDAANIQTPSRSALLWTLRETQGLQSTSFSPRPSSAQWFCALSLPFERLCGPCKWQQVFVSSVLFLC